MSSSASVARNFARSSIERQEFSCYLPTLTVEKRRNGRKFDARELLFPGYLFIQLDDVTTTTGIPLARHAECFGL